VDDLVDVVMSHDVHRIALRVIDVSDPVASRQLFSFLFFQY